MIEKSIELPEQYSFSATCKLFSLLLSEKILAKMKHIFTRVLHNKKENFLVAGLHFIRQTCRLGEMCVLCKWPHRNICKHCLLIDRGLLAQRDFVPRAFACSQFLFLLLGQWRRVLLEYSPQQRDCSNR